MTDRLSEIQDLQRRRDAAQTSLTQAQTRREALVERRDEIEAKMTAMGVTPDNAEEKLQQLIVKRDQLIEEAKTELDAIDVGGTDSLTSSVDMLI